MTSERMSAILIRTVEYNPSMTYREYQERIVNNFRSINFRSTDEMKATVQMLNSYVGSSVHFTLHHIQPLDRYQVIIELGEPIPDETFRNYMAQPIIWPVSELI